METNIERNSAGEYIDSNHIIFWSGLHPENKIGIYMMGGCDLPSVFSCVPLIKPILKGTCCIFKEGQIEKSSSDLLLQNLKNYPQNLLAPVLHKFNLSANFFENQLFRSNFCVSNGSSFEEFPKQVVILSIAPDVTRVMYQHREHGFLIDPSGWWNNQPIDLMLKDLSSANWFRKHFVSLGRMTVEAFIESFTELIGQIKRVTNAHVLVFNTLTVESRNINHNSQFLKRHESLRRREFNLALIELSKNLNFCIVDIDTILKQTRTKHTVDFAHFPMELYQPIGQEVFRILEELEIFKVSIQPSTKLKQTQWELLKFQSDLQYAQEHYTEKDVEQLLKNYIIQQFMQETGEAYLENDCLLIEEGIIDSLGIFELINFMEKHFNIKISTKEVVLENFINIDTIKLLVMSHIRASIEQVITSNKKENSSSLVPIKPNGCKRPLFYVHGLGGHGSCLTLGRYLHPERPFYGLKAVGLDGEKAPYTRIEDMVAYYIQEIQTVQPEGPYLLGGLCIGGIIALEMAQQLKKRSQEVSLVVMADSPNPFWTEEEKIELASWLSSQKSSWVKEQINSGFSLQQVENILRVRAANIQLISSHIPQVYSGQVVHFSALETIESLDEITMQRARERHDPMQPNGWNSLVAGGIELHKVPGSHLTFFKEPHIRVFAEKFNACLEQADCEEKTSAIKPISTQNNSRKISTFDKHRSPSNKEKEIHFPALQVEKKTMNKKQVTDIYDEDYAQEYNQRFLLNDLSKNNADFEQETINNLLDEIGEGAKWLDVACGTGYFLSRFPNVERAGLDISPAMLKVAKQANPDALFVQGDYRDKRPQWEGNWDLVSCMWWAYSYVESLSELEKVIENFASWTSKRGICFLPVCDPAELGTGELKLPYTSKDMGEGGGYYRFEGVIWSWIDEEAEKHHLALLAPQVEYMVSLLKKHFERVEIIEYPSFGKGQRKAIVARSKKQKLTQKSKYVNENFFNLGVLSSFFKMLRASEWWLYKIAPLLAVAYAEILLIHLPLQSIITVVTFLLSISSVAAYGYIVNDIFDIEVDRKAGKSNAMAQLLPRQRFLFCLLFVATGFAVPVLMKFGTLTIILLAINYLLPMLYSAPPLRLKERGIWGILSDAAGAHLIPTLFVAATFLNLSAAPQPNALTFSIVAAAWAFFAGVRGILLHQLWDRDNDLNAGISTFVTQFQPESVRLWINRLVFPCEIILFTGLAVVLSRFYPWLLGFFTVYVLVTLTKLNVTQTPLDPSPAVGQNIIPHDLYEVWLPLALAILLVTRNPVFLIFFGLTLVLFYPSIKIRAMEVVNVFKVVFSHSNPVIQKTREKEQLEEQLENLREQLALKTQELEAQQLETLQAKTETDRDRESLQQFQEQAQKQIEPLQTQLQEAKAQRQHTQSELQTAQTELTQSQSELQTTQTELAQLKSYLQQTQGVEGIMSYYRFCIASNPDYIQLYHQALTIKPDDAQSYWQLGNALVRQNCFDDAIASYQTALQYQPDNFEIHLELGKALEKQKKWEDAIASYRRAIELNPDYSWSHKHLGDILAERDQINEASLCYRRALQLQPRIF